MIQAEVCLDALVEVLKRDLPSMIGLINSHTSGAIKLEKPKEVVGVYSERLEFPSLVVDWLISERLEASDEPDLDYEDDELDEANGDEMYLHSFEIDLAITGDANQPVETRRAALRYIEAIRQVIKKAPKDDKIIGGKLSTWEVGSPRPLESGLHQRLTSLHVERVIIPVSITV